MRSSLQQPLQYPRHRLCVGFTTELFLHLADQKVEQLRLSALVIGDLQNARFNQCAALGQSM